MTALLHIITGTNVGGAEMMLLRLLEAGDPTRLRQSVLSLLQDGPLGARMAERAASYESLGMARALPSPSQAMRMMRITRSAAPQLVMGWMYHGALAATAAQGFAARQAPLVWGIHHSLNALRQEPRMTQRIIRLLAWLSPRAGAIIYVSKQSQAQHEALGFDRRRSVLIPNGIDTDSFKPDPMARGRLRALLNLSEGKPIIGMIARADPMKDHPNLVRALGLLKAKGREAHLVLFGRGTNEPEGPIADAVKAAGVSPCISLMGERHDLKDLVPGLDVLALSSAWGEAFPLVLAEAMASGIPCVATDIGDSAWLIGDTGLIVPPREPEALAMAIDRLLSLTPEERAALGARARARIVNDFGLAKIARVYEDLYASLIRR